MNYRRLYRRSLGGAFAPPSHAVTEREIAKARLSLAKVVDHVGLDNQELTSRLKNIIVLRVKIRQKTEMIKDIYDDIDFQNRQNSIIGPSYNHTIEYIPENGEVSYLQFAIIRPPYDRLGVRYIVNAIETDAPTRDDPPRRDNGLETTWVLPPPRPLPRSTVGTSRADMARILQIPGIQVPQVADAHGTTVYALSLIASTYARQIINSETQLREM